MICKNYVMTIFKKRVTLTENIAYMGIMAAINLLFVLLTTLFPFLLFLIVFVLPLTSAIVTIYCKKKYFIIYAISTIALCSLITIWNIGDTLFYVIPSIVSGFLFAVLLEKKVNSLFIILITSIIQIIFSYLSIPLIKLITGLSIIDTFVYAFGVNGFIYIDFVIPAFIFLISFMQQIISYAVIKDEIEKFASFEIKKNDELIISISNFFLLILMIVFAIIIPQYSLLLLCISIVIATYQFVNLMTSKNYITYILLAIGLLISFFVFAILYSSITKPLGILLIGLYSFLVTSISLINNYLLKENSKYRINI